MVTLKRTVDTVQVVPMGEQNFGVIFKYKLHAGFQQSPVKLVKNAFHPENEPMPNGVVDYVAKGGKAEEHASLTGLNYFDLITMRNKIDKFLQEYGHQGDKTNTNNVIKE